MEIQGWDDAMKIKLQLDPNTARILNRDASQAGGSLDFEVSSEAEQLIRTWIDEAAVEHPAIRDKGVEIASALVCAGVRSAKTNLITSADVYRGWNKHIAEAMLPSIGLCPPHKCLLRSIMQNEGLIRETLKSPLMEDAIRRIWG